MKKFITLTVTAILSCSIAFSKIWRVNNTPGITADFSTAQAAHDGAAAKDTIYLEPSTADYGSLTTSKRLTWISTGNFLAAHPGLQYSWTPGTLAGVAVNAGSDSSVFSCNAISIICNTSDVTFLRCFVASTYLYLNNVNKCVVSGCYINAYLYLHGNNNIVSNNIINEYIVVPASSSAIITNNVINAAVSNASTIHNSTIQSNIFNQVSSIYTFINCLNLSNNMANNASLPAGSGNQNNVNMSTVFVNYSGTTDGDFVLKAGSPAIGTGYLGVNMGAFGGGSPFALGMQPAIPAIYQLSAPAVPTGTTMNVTFSTKSNN